MKDVSARHPFTEQCISESGNYTVKNNRAKLTRYHWRSVHVNWLPEVGFKCENMMQTPALVVFIIYHTIIYILNALLRCACVCRPWQVPRGSASRTSFSIPLCDHELSRCTFRCHSLCLWCRVRNWNTHTVNHVSVAIMTSTYIDMRWHRVSKKLCKHIFCQNFAKFRWIVKIFGTRIAERTSFSEVYSFSTSPNLFQHTTVWNADVQNCYITL